jgi:hypothetical protein
MVFTYLPLFLFSFLYIPLPIQTSQSFSIRCLNFAEPIKISSSKTVVFFAISLKKVFFKVSGNYLAHFISHTRSQLPYSKQTCNFKF